MRNKEIWKYGNMEIWKYGSMEIEKQGNRDILKYGNMDLWKNGNIEVWKQGNLEIQQTLKLSMFWRLTHLVVPCTCYLHAGAPDNNLRFYYNHLFRKPILFCRYLREGSVIKKCVWIVSLASKASQKKVEGIL